MGEVYEATQMQLARRVAVKTIRADLASKPELLARFRREAESAAALGHPNLVQVTDFHAAPGEASFLVMELLEGSTLKDVLEREGRIDPGRAAFIGVQLLSGLAAAHRAGIVHRDVKPANVFLQSTTAMSDLVKVLDFGVAKLALDAIPGAQAMTQAGEVLGTLSYMAPEQAVSGAAIDGRTDIFGVGATLFHALAGVRPVDVTEPGVGRTPLDRVAPWLNRDLAAVIERALAKSPDARWPHADEMAAALQPFASGGRASAPPQALPSQPAQGGWNPAAIGRMEAPTGGSAFGAADTSMYAPRDATLLGHGARAPAVAPPPAYGSSPAVSGAAPPGAVPYTRPSTPQLHPPAPMVAPFGGYAASRASIPVPYGQPLPKKSPPYWIIVVAVVVLGTGIPALMSLLAIRRATDPDTIATNVEREVLKQQKQPCPPPDQCTQSVEEHDLTYTLCSRRQPQLTPYKPGEMVLAGSDKRIALIQSDLGARRYAIRFLTGKQEETINDEDIAGRLCKNVPR